MMTPTQLAAVALALIDDSYQARYEEMGQRVASLSWEEMGHIIPILTLYGVSAVQSMCGEVVDPAAVLGALGQAVMDTARAEEETAGVQ